MSLMLEKFTTAVTNDRSLSDTRRIISTLSARIIKLFIPVFAMYVYFSASGKLEGAINKHLRFTDRGTRNPARASHNNGRIIYWKLENF